MDYVIVLDTSALIWDINDYNTNTNQYYKIKDGISSFIDLYKLQQPYILFNSELIDQVIQCFPFDNVAGIFNDFAGDLFSFLSGIPTEKFVLVNPVNHNIYSIPDIIKDHFNIHVRNQINYLLTHIHHNININNIFISFMYLYNTNEKLKTCKNCDTGNIETQEYETILADNIKNVQDCLQKYKRKFEPNPVHHSGKKHGDKKSPLSCFDGYNKQIPQEYLEKSYSHGKEFFYYDTINEVYVVFKWHDNSTNGILYHGHDEPDINKIDPRVKKHFNKW